jgi:uncharacterized integral membrane protein
MGEAENRAGGRRSIYLGVGVVFIAFAIVLLIYFFGTVHWDALMVSLTFFVLGSLFSVQSAKVKASDAERSGEQVGGDGTGAG